MPTIASSNPPDFQQYVAAFQAIGKLKDDHLQILQIHYHAHEQTITAKQLAQAMGYSHHATANMMYGRLARWVSEKLNYNPELEKLGTLVTFEKREGEWHWILRPEVSQALQVLGWIERNTVSLFPDEVDSTEVFREGAVRQVTVNAYERDPRARQKCIDYYGLNCSVCNFNFGETFGQLGKGFIHVHHLCPISEIGEEYEVDPVKDLRPVCPNCHAMIHRRSPPLSFEEIIKLKKSLE
ncbi:MAG: HNH endonuclease [Scytolyngbya sp. HA4215-MV1]|jgi:putative restriction endonuclease|nr:HNH endonuclease [Scytolyngbya sp. HA4215-MV1]